MTDSVLFDLDGTLLDTHRDLADALNTVLRSAGRKPWSMDALRPYVSRGAMRMVCMAFGCDSNSREAQDYWQQMLDRYQQNIAQHTALFAGIDQVLIHLQNNHVPWGIVTNKPEYLTHQLLETLALPYIPGVVISGDTLLFRKPHPAPILEACRLLGADPANSVYIGDDVNDIKAGKNAGTKTIAVTYGFFPEDENPQDWDADYLIHNSAELLALLQKLICPSKSG